MATTAQPAPGNLQPVDWPGWKSFGIAMLSLAGALVLALYSSAMAQAGHTGQAATLAVAALAVAAWVAIAIVPKLARRTSLRWLAVRTDYRLPREGAIYLAGVLILGLAAVNTGNNLLFMMLACALAGILVSGVLSQTVLAGVELRLDLPEHIFAGRPVLALAELANQKRSVPSFSLRLVGAPAKSRRAARSANESQPNDVLEILRRPVYFPYIPRRQTAQQNVELTFPRRGIYRQDSLGLQTRFPFGFLEKTRRVQSSLRAVVYPPVEPTDEVYEILPLVSGELESFMRGRGNDIYAIRDYQSTDSAHHVDWKATAKMGALQVREFAREDERRVLLVLDPTIGTAEEAAFERAVALCASLAWHFYELDSVLGFRTAGFETPMAPANEVIYEILGRLAGVEPQPAPQNAIDKLPNALLEGLSDCPGVFKIVLTCQPRGSMPASLWSSSYVRFINS